MTHAELAKKIREAVYDRANHEGGAISREQMDDAIEGALAKLMPKAPSPAWPYAHMTLTTAAPSPYVDYTLTRQEEWR